jgi:hypothetical protein
VTVRVDLSQAPARVVVTGTVGDLRDGRVPRFWLEFGGDGSADVVIEPDAPLEVATRLRAAVMLLLEEAEAITGHARRGRPRDRGRSVRRAKPARSLLRVV